MPKFNNISSRNKIPTRFRGVTEAFQQEGGIGANGGVLGGFFKDKFVVAFALAWLLPIIGTTFYIIFTISSLPLEIPLFYSRVWGEGQLAPKELIYLPVIGAFALGFVNMFISFILKNKDKLFTYLLMATGALLSILASITVFNIINLVS